MALYFSSIFSDQSFDICFLILVRLFLGGASSPQGARSQGNGMGKDFEAGELQNSGEFL